MGNEERFGEENQKHSVLNFVVSEFDRMKKMAEENQQPIPIRYFKNRNEYFVEVVGMNPLFLCKKVENGWINCEGDLKEGNQK